MHEPRLILTSSGLSRPLAAELSRWLGDPQAKAMWYLPTAPLRDGWSKQQAEQQMAGLKRQLGVGRCEWIDVEYTKGAELAAAVAKLGAAEELIIYAEMGNTYNLCTYGPRHYSCTACLLLLIMLQRNARAPPDLLSRARAHVCVQVTTSGILGAPRSSRTSLARVPSTWAQVRAPSWRGERVRWRFGRYKCMHARTRARDGNH